MILIGLFGCSQTQTKTVIPISEKIKGDWKTEYFKENRIETAHIFTFQDSTCSYLTPVGEFSNYWITGDTLNIKERTHKRGKYINNGKNIYQLLIDSITTKILYLKPITDQTKELFDYKNEVIKLSKIKKYRDWRIERIGFYCTGCFGSCPSMYLEIDSIGNILFSGNNHTEKKGFYSGVIPKKEMEILKSKINNIQLDSLNNRYFANWTDDQTCGMIIKTKSKTYECSAYGIYKEPIELRILFHRLTELYKNVALKKDSSIVYQFQFKGIKHKLPPPPPPNEKQ